MTPRSKGLTFVELLMALVVTGIVASAVVTISFALSTAEQQGRDFSRQQAEFRQANLTLVELLRNARLVCGFNGPNLVIWARDEQDLGRINVSELVVIERGSQGEKLIVHELQGDDILSLSETATFNWQSRPARASELIGMCRNVQFVLFDNDNEVISSGPAAFTRRVSIIFGAGFDNSWRKYHITAGLRGWAGHMLKQENGTWQIESGHE